MRLALPTVQMFWHGPPLSRIERLSMASFVQNGHPVDLYVYDEPQGVPDGVRLMQASSILPRSALFRQKRTHSWAAFADWFRYRLLHERGGIWADVDMVCLQPLAYDTPFVFAWQDDALINNAVLGLPARDALASWLAESCEHPNRMLPYDGVGTRLRKLKRRFLRGNRRDNVSWGEYGPLGLTSAARYLGYLDRALPSWHFYPVAHEDSRTLFESPPPGTAAPVFPESRAVHLWNYIVEAKLGLDKNARFAADSPFEKLWGRYLGDEA